MGMNFTRQMAASNGDQADTGTRVLGQDPETGLEVSIRSGRFGPYLQLGEQKLRFRRHLGELGPRRRLHPIRLIPMANGVAAQLWQAADRKDQPRPAARGLGVQK